MSGASRKMSIHVSSYRTGVSGGRWLVPRQDPPVVGAVDSFPVLHVPVEWPRVTDV